MPNTSVFGPRGLLAIRFYVGAGWVALGILSIFGGQASAYPATDQRSNPLFWIELGFAVAVAGALIAGYAVRDLRRRRRDARTGPGDIPEL